MHQWGSAGSDGAGRGRGRVVSGVVGVAGRSAPPPFTHLRPCRHAPAPLPPAAPHLLRPVSQGSGSSTNVGQRSAPFLGAAPMRRCVRRERSERGSGSPASCARPWRLANVHPAGPIGGGRSIPRHHPPPAAGATVALKPRRPACAGDSCPPARPWPCIATSCVPSVCCHSEGVARRGGLRRQVPCQYESWPRGAAAPPDTHHPNAPSQPTDRPPPQGRPPLLPSSHPSIICRVCGRGGRGTAGPNRRTRPRGRRVGRRQGEGCGVSGFRGGAGGVGG